jgi:hydrogenase expression/formation protein HypC
MCLAIPAKVIELYEPDSAVVDIGGVHKEVNVSLLPGLALHDYVIVHVGYALCKLDEAEAEKTLGLFAELGELAQGEFVGGDAK